MFYRSASKNCRDSYGDLSAFVSEIITQYFSGEKTFDKCNVWAADFFPRYFVQVLTKEMEL